MNNKVYAGGKRHLVIINKIDKKYDCYLNEEEGKDYILNVYFSIDSFNSITP